MLRQMLQCFPLDGAVAAEVSHTTRGLKLLWLVSWFYVSLDNITNTHAISTAVNAEWHLSSV